MSDLAEKAEWADLVCPLPVLRFTEGADGERGPMAVHHCGSGLHVEHIRDTYLLAGGEMDVVGPSWRVVCEGGHTLLMPDDEGNDWLGDMTFDVALVQEALVGIGVVAQGDGGINLRESGA